MPSEGVHDFSTFGSQEQQSSLYRCLKAEWVSITLLSAPMPLDLDAELVAEVEGHCREMLNDLELEPA
eukprot:44695-Eustigmatos_ZCMA.PRE.1